MIEVILSLIIDIKMLMKFVNIIHFQSLQQINEF